MPFPPPSTAASRGTLAAKTHEKALAAARPNADRIAVIEVNWGGRLGTLIDSDIHPIADTTGADLTGIINPPRHHDPRQRTENTVVYIETYFWQLKGRVHARKAVKFIKAEVDARSARAKQSKDLNQALAIRYQMELSDVEAAYTKHCANVKAEKEGMEKYREF